MNRKVVIRYEYFKCAEWPVVEFDVEEESILNVEHAGNSWWVYIAKWLDDET